jgi:3-hydroxyacyl-CoA dehydrogenase/enoyl-CoA hydratase/3-hydroxybutyryl-CoA epimerase
VRNALDRLLPDLTGEGVGSADLVIEAVPEVLDLKRKVYAGIEPRMRPDAILATNTSSIPLEQLCEGLQRPERLVGLHFFNPVSLMQLVEVISHDKVAADVWRRARHRSIDRLPARSKCAGISGDRAPPTRWKPWFARRRRQARDHRWRR